MVHSLYLSRLSPDDRKALIHTLWEQQNGKCFISEQPIDLNLHESAIDIDHVIPIQSGGKDDPSNFALTLSSANRSKQAKDLNLARIEWNFLLLCNQIEKEKHTLPNLADVLKNTTGNNPIELKFNDKGDSFEYSFSEIGNNNIYKVPIYTDKLSNERYCFAVFPIEYINHDATINPRCIGPNVFNLIEEFYKKNPQLHISLDYIEDVDGGRFVKLFDGQHKAAAQILLGVKEIPVRLFLNPDKEKLRLSNLNAGTKLKQVAFDKSIQRNLGSTIYYERVKKYQQVKNIPDDNYSFSEKDLISFYSGESREIKRYIIDAIRVSIMQADDNRLTTYIEMGGKAKDKPLSYSSVEKTFFSFFISQDALSVTLDYKMEEGKNPRDLEKRQITRLMNIIADNIVIGKFDLELGTSRIEDKIRQGEKIDWNHVVAYRMLKEEILYAWLSYISQIVYNYFTNCGVALSLDQSNLFQMEFPNQLWCNIENFVINLSNLPLWKNKEFSSTIFGGKNNYAFWSDIFRTGVTSQGQIILVSPLNLVEMIKPLQAQIN